MRREIVAILQFSNLVVILLIPSEHCIHYFYLRTENECKNANIVKSHQTSG